MKTCNPNTGNILSETLRKLRGKRPLLTIEGLTGISHSRLWRYENGYTVDSGSLIVLCKFYRVTPNELLGWEITKRK